LGKFLSRVKFPSIQKEDKMNKVPARFAMTPTTPAQVSIANEVNALVGIMTSCNSSELYKLMDERLELIDAAIPTGYVFTAQVKGHLAYAVEVRQYQLTGRQGPNARYYM
jgi:hypothetical protein